MASPAPGSCGLNTRPRSRYNEAMSRRSARRRRWCSPVPAAGCRGGIAGFIESLLRDAPRGAARRPEEGARGGAVAVGHQASWGPELKLINISSTGVLVETGVKFAPGSTTNLPLVRPRDRAGRAGAFHPQRRRADRRTWCALSCRRGLCEGARSRRPRRAGGSRHRRPSTLAALLASVLSHPRERPEPAHARFAQGLRQLVGARDVRISSGRAGSPAGGKRCTSRSRVTTVRARPCR